MNATNSNWRMFAMPLLGRLSDVEIGTRVGVTPKAVGNLRRSLDIEAVPAGRPHGANLPPVALMVYRMLVEARGLLTVREISEAVECSDRRARGVLRDMARWGFAREAGVSDKGAPLWEVV